MRGFTGSVVPRFRGSAVERCHRTPRNCGTAQPRNRALLTLILLVGSLTIHAQTARIASDFEIQQMEQQAAREHDFTAQFSAHMNLGDSRTTRNEISLATAQYRQSEQIAQDERAAARKASDMRRYAMATMCVALADAKLNRPVDAFELLEEAIRYSSDDAKTWNIYASAMTELGHPSKAVAAARNAVAVQEAEMSASPSVAQRIDLAIYSYSLGNALAVKGQSAEAEEILRKVISSLRAKEFDGVRKAVARSESFQVYSTVRGDGPAYLSLLNRGQLRLAELYEKDGDVARARKVYEDMLKDRTDEPSALAALARLKKSGSEQADTYVDAFDANPFSIDLIRDYERWLQSNATKPNDAATDGALMRRALEQRAAGENVAARDTLETLAAKFPQNDVVQYLAARNDIDLGELARARSRTIGVPDLRQEIESRLAAAPAKAPSFLSGDATTVNPTPGELRQLFAILEQQQITPEQRVQLDKLTFTSTATFDSASVSNSQTTLESGSMYGIRFRFSQPTAFAGSFAERTPLVFTYRVLGVTDLNGATALLLEPVRVEMPQETAATPSSPPEAAPEYATPFFLSGKSISVINPSAFSLRQLMKLIVQQKITPAQQDVLAKLIFTSSVSMTAESNGAKFDAGSIDGVPFRLSHPIASAGAKNQQPVTLRYRILGSTEWKGSTAFLLQPLKVEVPR